MATSTITQMNTSAAGITFGSVVTTSYDFFVQRYGKVVTLNGFLKFTATSNTVTKIATLDADRRPPKNVRAMGAIASNPWEIPSEIAYISIGTDGGISVLTSKSGTQTLYLSIAFMCA